MGLLAQKKELKDGVGKEGRLQKNTSQFGLRRH